jgi:pentapeptide MXKDX repeat protein
MRKGLCSLLVGCFAAVSITPFAQHGNSMKQDTMRQGTRMTHGPVKVDTMQQKSLSVSGMISANGKMFVSDDNRTWTVGNPDALKGNEGNHVTVKAHIDPGRNEIHTDSGKMPHGEMTGSMNGSEMKH